MKKDDLDGVDVAIRWTVWTVALAFVAACLVTLLALWTERAQAADVTPQQARDILAVAYGAYTGPPSLLDDPPKIHIVPQDQICEKMERHAGCGFVGMYDNTAIYLSDGLDFSTPFAASILLHEFLHVFQHRTRGTIKDFCPAGDYACMCQELTFRERQAYEIQAHVLEKVGSYVEARATIISGRRRFC